MGDIVISLQQVTKRYGDHIAVNSLSLAIERGEIFGLLGPNGAGKSTTILMMMGLTEPDEGTVSVCGIDSTREPIRVKRRVGYLPDDVGFYDDLSGFENLLYTGRLNGYTEREVRKRAAELLAQVGLSDAAHRRTNGYSRGMRQRLGLADVLMKDPEIIILDEPTLGIDPQGVKELLELIQRLSRELGITVLLSSHHLHQVQRICDRVGLFVRGRLLAVGDVRSLSAELFRGEPVRIELAFEPFQNGILEQLSQIEGIQRVDRQESEAVIVCNEDIANALARTVMEAGASLTLLRKQQYGLDELYEKYFEGEGTVDDAGNSSAMASAVESAAQP